MDAFIGEIKAFPFNFAPRNWVMCNGALLPIAQNQALFSLLSTIYGGNGTTTFAVPDLQGRTPLHCGTDTGGRSYALGTKAGTETVTLDTATIPAHAHGMNAVSSAATQGNASNALPSAAGAVSPNPTVYLYTAAGQPTVTLAGDTISGGGNQQPHPNMQPFQVLNFCICVNGIYPPRP